MRFESNSRSQVAQTASCDVSISRVTSRWRRASVSSERFLLSFFSTLRHSTQKDWRKKAVFKETTAYFSSPSRGRFTVRPYFRSFLLKESLAPYSYSAEQFLGMLIYHRKRYINTKYFAPLSSRILIGV